MSLLLTARPRASADTYLMARQHILWPAFATARSAGISYAGDASSMFGGYEASDNTVGRYWEWADRVLSPGDYTIRILCYAAANYGKVHVSFNGVDTGATIDCNVAGGYNQVLSATFTVASKARGAVRLSMDSKTGSAYYGAIAQASVIKTSAGDDEGETVDDLPWVVDVPLMSYSSTSAGWARANSAYPGGGTTLYSDNANGRWIDYKVWLPAGTWSFSAIYLRDTAQGILEVLLDSSAVGTIDCYGSSSQLVGTISGITVPETKIYTVRLATNGKNASSGSYAMQFNALQFRRTA